MSFTSTVKEELARESGGHRHCRIAEMTAVISLCGKIRFDEDGRVSLEINSENETVLRKYFTLLKKSYNIDFDIELRQRASRSRGYQLRITDDHDARTVLKGCGLLAEFDEIQENCETENNDILQRDCCKRAYIRGAFLAAGSVNDPSGSYHFEIACLSNGQAQLLKELMSCFGVIAKIVRRKRYFVVYVKEGSQIVDLLNIMGAHMALMTMENVRIVKDVRNNVNRKVNCETANINKTVSAAVRQLEDIAVLKAGGMYDRLPESIREIADLREEYPEDSLVEIGKRCKTPVGKSGVNHRFSKIHELAEQLRAQDTGTYVK